MVYHGTIVGGVVVLEPGAMLPEGASVTVAALPDERSADKSPQVATPAIRNGVPVFPRSDAGERPGLELVNALRD